MAEKIINLSIDQWQRQYRPLTQKPAHVEETTPRLFETYGKDLKFVQKQPYNKVWTLTDSDDSDKMFIQNGIHFVNRVAYYVCEKPFDDNVTIQVS